MNETKNKNDEFLYSIWNFFAASLSEKTRKNYYNVINGYKSLFLEREATDVLDEKYKEGTTFNEVYALYCFDREVRTIYLKFLLKLENSIKTVIAHEFSSVYGHDNYLKLSNFQSTVSTDTSDLKYIAKTHRLDMLKANNSIFLMRESIK